MLNPILVLFGEQIESLKIEIEDIELHITSIEEAGAREHMSREVALPRDPGAVSRSVSGS
jgi:hypothetical protein